MDTLLVASKINSGLKNVSLQKCQPVVNNEIFFEKSKSKVDKINHGTAKSSIQHIVKLSSYFSINNNYFLKIKKDDNKLYIFELQTKNLEPFTPTSVTSEKKSKIKVKKRTLQDILNKKGFSDNYSVQKGVFEIRSCKIDKELWEGIYKADLKKLSLLGCHFSIDVDFSKLENLKYLTIRNAKKLLNFKNIEELTNLVFLDLHNNSMVKNMEFLPKNLKILHTDTSINFKNLENFDVIKKLEEFSFSNDLLQSFDTQNYLEILHESAKKSANLDKRVLNTSKKIENLLRNKLLKHITNQELKINFDSIYEDRLFIKNDKADQSLMLGNNLDLISEILEKYTFFNNINKLIFQDIDLKDDDIEKLKRFNQVKSLEINNTVYRELPENIFQLSQLQELSITGKSENNQTPDDAKFYYITDDIGLMKNLETLKIQFLMLEKISDKIGTLKKLRQLSINRTTISGLPKSIKDCSALTLVDLRNNYHLEQGNFSYQINPENQEEFMHYVGEDLDYLGINSLRDYFDDRFLHNQLSEEEPAVSNLTIQKVYEELDNTDSSYRINRDKLKATRMTEIPKAKSLDGKKVLENFESIRKNINAVEQNYKKHLGFIKTLFGLPIDRASGEVEGWQVKPENKKDLQNMLAYNLEQILLEKDQESKVIKFKLFQYTIEKCPAGQREGFDYLFKTFLGNVYSGERDLESIIKTKIIEFKENLFYNLVLDGQNQQNVHGLTFYKDKLKDELGLNSFLSSDLVDTTGVFTEKHGNPAEILKAFYGQFNPDNLADYMSKLYKPDNSKDKVNYPIIFQNIYGFLEKQSDINLKEDNWCMYFFDINPLEDFDNKAKLIESGAKILLEKLGYIVKSK